MSQRLVVDLGGTNSRFALVPEGHSLSCEASVYSRPLRNSASFLDALEAYLATAHPAVPPSSVAVAAAGPVEGGRVALTNAPWVIEASAVSARLDGAPVTLLNDLEAVALALPWLAPTDAETVRPGNARAGAPQLALNIGTGFGASLLVPLPGGAYHALAAEPGHMRFAAVTEAERALLDMIKTVEDLCSGRGVAALYGRLAGQPKGGPAADEILARVGDDPTARAVRDLMLSVAGRVAGDLVLATGAWGGLWLTGGVVSAWSAEWRAPFLEHLDYKGPMTDRMRAVPISRIAHPHPALLGLSRAPLAG